MKKIVFILIAMTLASCVKEKPASDHNQPYDPSRPIELTSITPTNGKAREKIIIKGSNFGIDKNEIQVLFNRKPAGLVSVRGDMIHVIAPLRADSENHISIVHGKDTVKSSLVFNYETTVNMSTVVGHPETSKDAKDQFDGTLLEARMRGPEWMVMDSEDNMFIVQRHQHRLRQVNIAKNVVTTLLTQNSLWFRPPFKDGNIIYLADYKGYYIYRFDPERTWKPEMVRLDFPGEIKDIFITSGAFNPVDHCMYLYLQSGYLVKFDLKKHTSEIVWQNEGIVCEGYICFDTINPDLLYISMLERHCIASLNIKTKEIKIVAGVPGKAGWADGKGSDALFHSPCQICVDEDGVIYVPDDENHVIRKISTEGYVSTLIGQPGVLGYKDGIPGEALMNRPRSVALGSDHTIYVTDWMNHTIRGLRVE